ncbi:MAG: phosphatase PAP2 family protein [Bacteroidetes bacterium]|nr:phosphatase PAP2 family protein [Bacteroidota bacterium]
MSYQNFEQIIIHTDYTIWYYLNIVWQNSFLDTVVPYIRNQWTWAPLYLFLLIFMLKNYGLKGALWCLFFLATFAVSDQLSAHLLKPIFMRLRPCNNPFLQPIAHVIVPCGSGFSFPSSHAANHFALAVFASLSLRFLGKWIVPTALAWALFVSYSQVYVGVHFPLDVFCGGLLGTTIGLLTGFIFNRFFSLNEQNKKDALKATFDS